MHNILHNTYYVNNFTIKSIYDIIEHELFLSIYINIHEDP